MKLFFHTIWLVVKQWVSILAFLFFLPDIINLIVPGWGIVNAIDKFCKLSFPNNLIIVFTLLFISCFHLLLKKEKIIKKLKLEELYDNEKINENRIKAVNKQISFELQAE